MEDARSSCADSYIGSLISLISKSEIRYEGVLYTVDTKNSNIALQNVRSFGTEYRKKDGLQIAPSDKVYDYIVFRGSDIKDLEVVSAPLPQIHNDPAIVSFQAQCSHSTSSSLTYIPPDVGSSVQQSPMQYPGSPSSPFQIGSSLYQPDAGSGLWIPPLLPPGSNGAGVSMPFYWPGAGYYRPPGQAHLQQHLSSQNVPLSAALQAPIPASNYSSPPFVSQPINTTTSSQLRTLLDSSTLPALTTFPVSVSLATTIQLSAIHAGTSLSMPKVANMMPSSPDMTQDVSVAITPSCKTPRRELSLPSRLDFQLSNAPIHGVSAENFSRSTLNSATASSSQQMQSPLQGLAFSKRVLVSGLNMPNERTEDEVPLSSMAQSATMKYHQLEHQHASDEPLLPLPTMPTQQKHAFQVAHSAKSFTEDFDFTAMNEKFKKDEVWGELGKGQEENFEEEEEDPAEVDLENSVLIKASSKPSHEMSKKAAYVKDGFFDSLSCNAFDYEEGRSERTKFSTQRKIDTETFGSFPIRARGSRGMCSRGRGGRSKSTYNGGHSGNTGRGSGSYRRGRGLVRSSSAF